jgi:hypothetical protein
MSSLVDCPGCRHPMQRVVLERKPIGTVEVDRCGECQAFWFDAFESPQLAPTAILTLLRAIQSSTTSRRPLPARLPCPRCSIALKETHDLMRATRFTYWRCERGHGRLTPFVQFLREKEFIRPLPQAEIERLKAHVRTIRCGGCGAAVDLERATVCAYCGAPIVALDPDAVARAVDRLQQGTKPTPAEDLDRIAGRILAVHAEAGREQRAPMIDLIEIGSAAIADWLAD